MVINEATQEPKYHQRKEISRQPKANLEKETSW
jgi:hypothetical protein